MDKIIIIRFDFFYISQLALIYKNSSSSKAIRYSDMPGIQILISALRLHFHDAKDLPNIRRKGNISTALHPRGYLLAARQPTPTSRCEDRKHIPATQKNTTGGG